MLNNGLLNGRLNRGRLLLLLRFQRQLAQRLANVFKAFGVRLLRGFIGVQLLLHNVFGFQKQVDNLGAQAHFLASCTVQQVLQQVGSFLQHRKAKGRRTALDRVCRAEDGVQRLDIGGQRIQLQQVLLHVGQQLVRLIKEGLIKIANVHAHGVTSGCESRLVGAGAAADCSGVWPAGAIAGDVCDWAAGSIAGGVA